MESCSRALVILSNLLSERAYPHHEGRWLLLSMTLMHRQLTNTHALSSFNALLIGKSAKLANKIVFNSGIDSHCFYVQ